MTRTKIIAIWTLIAVAMTAPVAVAAFSPLLQWRDGIYIAAGFAGIVGLSLLLVQPLLAMNALPGLTPRRSRQVHGWVGAALVVAILIHVGGLWITSPPDVIDVLLLRSPTPFSLWGVAAMWAAFASAALVVGRRRWRLRPAIWRSLHIALANVIVGGTVVHALLIEGTMGTASKWAVSVIVILATAVIATRRIFPLAR